MRVEVCANSLESALNAERAGADQIELCSALAVGGITPSYGLLKSIREQISIPVNVLIRPRSGNFVYSQHEFDLMKKDIALCSEMGFDGVVSGALKADFSVAIDRTKALIDASGDMKFTFHRAFDLVAEPYVALAKIEAMGVAAILTSGQQKTATSGIELLSSLLNNTTNTVIMPGSGINASNAHLFKEKGFEVIHLSAVKMIDGLNATPNISMNSPHLLSSTAVPISSLELIQKVVKIVK